MIILSIDPGNIESGYCYIRDDYKPVLFGKETNEELLQEVIAGGYDVLVVEMVAHYGKGMPAGKTVFDTVRWIGRFEEAAKERGKTFDLILRIEEKVNLCKDSRAKDANIRQALIDRFAKTPSGKGTKKEPDFFYGFAADAWMAYATGATWIDKKRRENPNAFVDDQKM